MSQDSEPSAVSIFRNASTTYFVASLFFPKLIKDDVFTLYAFVRVADDFVDSIPQDGAGLQRMLAEYKHALSGQKTESAVIAHFVELQKRVGIKTEWVEAFFASMYLDTLKHEYRTLSETCSYMYGSAEVIGLMMACILQLPPRAYPAARMLGRAMQYANMIRDIAEDVELGRQYIPSSELHMFGLTDLQFETVAAKPEQFKLLLQRQIGYYTYWQQFADLGLGVIPKRLRAPIAAASDMYRETLAVIAKDPFIVYEKKVKPPKHVVAVRTLEHLAYDLT